MDDRSLDANFNSILKGQLPGAELVLGLVGAVGADLGRIEKDIKVCLERYGYDTESIRVSALIERFVQVPSPPLVREFDQIMAMMTKGDEARKETGDNAILALAAAMEINGGRESDCGSITTRPRQAYVINSLKHPEEVNALRRIYGNGFYLIGTYVGRAQRRENLIRRKNMSQEEADTLMRRDEEEGLENGQRTRETFHLSDVFVHLRDDEVATRAELDRFLEIVFANPYKTPLFDEYAMFMAFAAATRSADLSRQIGAVITRGNEVLATGVNECPCAGGGTYWPAPDESGRVVDAPKGRDYIRGCDSNDAEKRLIVEGTLAAARRIWKAEGKAEQAPDEQLLRKALTQGPIDDITEYGRVVHAEMNALLTCARNSIGCQGATLYTTTFPCHNCAKHIIAAGIARVVYIEPYPKSKAMAFHDDAAFEGFRADFEEDKRVAFEPFVGVGPRRFFDLFSMRLGSGFPLRRKDSESGNVLPWVQEAGAIRIPMLPWNYLQREELAVSIVKIHLRGGHDGEPGADPGQAASSDTGAGEGHSEAGD